MAVGNYTLFNTGKEALLTDNANQINWASDTIVAVLVNASYTPAATHSTWNDVVAHHSTGTNYAPVVVTGKTSARSGGTILWDCADVDFGSTVTITTKYIVFLKRAAGALATSDQLIGYCDLENASTSATVSSTNSGFVVNTTNGLFDI